MTDTYRPRYGRDDGPPPMPAAVQNSMYHFQGNRDAERRGRPAERRFRPRNHFIPRPHLSVRPLLTEKHDALDLQAFNDPQATDKFRNLADITDSEEDEMAVSEDDLDLLPPSKRLRTDPADPIPASSAPKWSNPDPYTALPPEMDVTGKKVDVVKLIRKAKISEEKKKEEGLTQNDDFISFDVADPIDLFPGVPTAPRSERLGKRKRDEENAVPRPLGGYRPRKDDSVLHEWTTSDKSKSTPWHIPCLPNDVAGTA